MTWIRWNITGSEFNPIQNTELYYVPLSDYLVLGFILFFMLFVMTLLLFEWVRSSRLLDRYRLKYSFDRDIESKECSKEDTEVKLNKRERRFKRSVFKD
jgi:hypothetical protein